MPKIFTTRKILSILVMTLISQITHAQNDRPNIFYVSEILIAKEKEGKLISKDRFSQNTNVELDLEEQFYLIIRKQNAQLPYDPLSFESCIKEVQIETSFQGKIYEPIIKPLSCTTSPTPSNYPLKCKDVIPNEVKDKLNSRNINELKITIRLKWYKSSEIPINCKQVFPTDLFTERVDVFTIDVKHFGVLILVDFDPVASTNTMAQFSDALLGIAYNLSYTGIDYALISKDNNFTAAMLTTPVIRIEGRNWIHKNIEAHFTLVKDLNNSNNYLGYGGGIGLLGDTKILKAGVFWYNNEPPRYYLGFSLIGLTKWLTKQNKL